MSDVEWIELPDWAIVTDKRRAHISRVTSLLGRWAAALQLSADESRSWTDAGRLHDALRDAPEADLRRLAGNAEMPAGVLHGPACAAKLRASGETRADLLDAITWHTAGSPSWARTGRALYMADYLDPGRSFAQRDRAFLADQVVHDFDGVFRQVVKSRIEWTLSEGKALFPETIGLWNAVR